MQIERITNVLRYARSFLNLSSRLTSEQSLASATGSHLYIRVNGARFMASRACYLGLCRNQHVFDEIAGKSGDYLWEEWKKQVLGARDEIAAFVVSHRPGGGGGGQKRL